MARIVGGIGTSHVPTIGVAYDKGKQEDAAWKPLFDGYRPVARWLEERKVDTLVFFYDDHCSAFFFDLYPTFSLGVGSEFAIADEGAGLRDLPPVRGDVEFQAHMAGTLLEAGVGGAPRDWIGLLRYGTTSSCSRSLPAS